VPVFTDCGGSWARDKDGWGCNENGTPFSGSWGGSWGVYPFFPSGLIVASSNSPVSAGTFILNYTGPASPSMSRRRRRHK
jgi:hypothetical protein